MALTVAAALLVPAGVRAPTRPQRPGRPGAGSSGGPGGGGGEGVLRRWRAAWALLACAGSAAVVGGAAALPVGAVVAVVVWVVAGRIEAPAVRRRREEVRRDLPHVVALLAATLRSGAAPASSLGIVARALPGAAADRLSAVAARLDLGEDPAAVWRSLASDDVLGPLGRTLARAHRTGAPVVAEVERLGEELARRARAEVEDRARAVGVRAAVPLGVCLLPSFLLLGIVPLVAGLVAALRW
jgi:Flp pilus assembly protein TadB